jgi:hypothetical protein
MESGNVKVLKILKTWWEGTSSKEPGVDGEEGEEWSMTQNSFFFCGLGGLGTSNSGFLGG